MMFRSRDSRSARSFGAEAPGTLPAWAPSLLVVFAVCQIAQSCQEAAKTQSASHPKPDPLCEGHASCSQDRDPVETSELEPSPAEQLLATRE